MDFIVDGLANGRMVRILSVVDVFTRECLALEADTSLGGGRMTRVLERLIDERGVPENVRSENGQEFTSRRVSRIPTAPLQLAGVSLVFGKRGRAVERCIHFQGKVWYGSG